MTASNLKYCSIDLENSTYDEIKVEIERLQKLQKDLYNEEQGIKIFINSIYGAFGNPYFLCYNVNIAEAITQQGVDISLHAKKIFDNYFSNHWHNDKKLHKKLGIVGDVEPIGPDSLLIQGDTDSAYFRFDHVIKSARWDKDPIDLVLNIYKYRLHKYIIECYNRYAEKRNTINMMDFEFEKLIRIGIFVAKKNYAIEICWKTTSIKSIDSEVVVDGIRYEKPKLDVTGLEAFKPSHPSWCRKKLEEMLDYILEQSKTNGIVQFQEVVKLLKKWRKEMEFQNFDELSETISISNYDKYVINDRTEIVLKPKAMPNIKGAAIYNYKLNRSSSKLKYHRIKSGDKVKLYYSESKSKKDEVFCYLPQNHPLEFAPKMDFDKQFAKKVIEPTNRLLEAMGMRSIPENLIVSNPLF